MDAVGVVGENSKSLLFPFSWAVFSRWVNMHLFIMCWWHWIILNGLRTCWFVLSHLGVTLNWSIICLLSLLFFTFRTKVSFKRDFFQFHPLFSDIASELNFNFWWFASLQRHYYSAFIYVYENQYLPLFLDKSFMQHNSIALEQRVFILWQFTENLFLQPSEACLSHFIYIIVLDIFLNLSSYIKSSGLILFMEYNLLLTVSLAKVVRFWVSCFEQGYVTLKSIMPFNKCIIFWQYNLF